MELVAFTMAAQHSRERLSCITVLFQELPQRIRQLIFVACLLSPTRYLLPHIQIRQHTTNAIGGSPGHFIPETTRGLFSSVKFTQIVFRNPNEKCTKKPLRDGVASKCSIGQTVFLPALL